MNERCALERMSAVKKMHPCLATSMNTVLLNASRVMNTLLDVFLTGCYLNEHSAIERMSAVNTFSDASMSFDLNELYLTEPSRCIHVFLPE